MYTDKKNILQLVALLKAHRIQKIVLCPGSRNIPIVQTLVNIPEFTCYPVTDERSAGFFALGLALNGGSPAAICCTSGTALLNIHPAVAEAFLPAGTACCHFGRPPCRMDWPNGRTDTSSTWRIRKFGEKISQPARSTE